MKENKNQQYQKSKGGHKYKSNSRTVRVVQEVNRNKFMKQKNSDSIYTLFEKHNVPKRNKNLNTYIFKSKYIFYIICRSD